MIRHRSFLNALASYIKRQNLMSAFISSLPLLLCQLFFFLIVTGTTGVRAQDSQKVGKTDPSAVVYIYHRFGEGKYPTTNTTVEQLEAQIQYLQNGGFHFLDYPTFKKHLQSDTPFPRKSILFTVDDGYESVYTTAWPRLKKAGIPLTLFIATDPVDQKIPGYLSWDQIRTLHQEGVTIGHHTASHLHMVHAGKDAAEKDIDKASKRFQAELGFIPRVFAYPYGEYSKEIETMVATKGFDIAFGQHSGATGLFEQMHSLPRYAVNEKYGQMSRYRLISNSLALPVSAVVPTDPYINDVSKNPPMIGFTLDKKLAPAKGLTCYPSHLGGKTATLKRPIPNRIEVRFDQPLPTGRSRINCTLMGKEGRWYWFSRLFLVPGGPLD